MKARKCKYLLVAIIKIINNNLRFSFHPFKQNMIFIEINSLKTVGIKFVNVIYFVYPKLYVMYVKVIGNNTLEQEVKKKFT